MRAELGISESGLARLIRAAFELLEPDHLLHRRRGQGGDGARAAPRLDRLGRRRQVHTEIQQAFVRAEVVALAATWSTPAATPRPATAVCCAPRDAAMSSPTAT